MNATLPISRITDDEFDSMIARGMSNVLGRVELRNGVLHRMNAQYVAHARAKRALFLALYASVRNKHSDLEVDVEVSVRFGGGFTPLPDVIVSSARDVVGTVPGADARLIVEIADTTQADDLGPKRDSYARVGLPEYWVVDLAARVLHRCSEPVDGVYKTIATFKEGSTVKSATLDGVAVAFSLSG